MGYDYTCLLPLAAVLVNVHRLGLHCYLLPDVQCRHVPGCIAGFLGLFYGRMGTWPEGKDRWLERGWEEVSEEKKENVCGKERGQITILSSLLVVPSMYHFVHRYHNAPRCT